MMSDHDAALRGSEALAELRRRETNVPSDELFRQVVAIATSGSEQPIRQQRFWLGAAFGGAIAASLFAIVMFFGGTEIGQGPVSFTAEFVVTLDEPRQMNLAFETDRLLLGAQISIVLSGDVEIAGYGMQRELTWSEDLDVGVNRLTLPLIASSPDGGQMVVRMTHPLSEQVFVINLPAES